MQFVQSEKLASLGQWLRARALKSNNPLTAILGYSELLADNPPRRPGAQSRGKNSRTGEAHETLVNNC